MAAAGAHHKLNQLKEQLNTFANNLQRISIPRADLIEPYIEVSEVNPENRVVIDGQPYRVAVTNVGHNVHRVTLTEFRAPERARLCDTRIGGVAALLVPNANVNYRFTCGSHGDNGPQATSWATQHADGHLSVRVAVIGNETAERLATLFFPPGVNGRHICDNFVTKLLSIQALFYELHRNIIAISNREFKAKRKRSMALVRSRLDLLERRSGNILADISIAYDVFSKAMVIHEVLPAIPVPHEIQVQQPGLVLNQQWEQSIQQLLAQPALAMPFSQLITKIQALLDPIAQRHQVMAENYVQFPAQPMYLNMNAPFGVYTVYVAANQQRVLNVGGGQGYRDVRQTYNHHMAFNCTYQTNIGRWLVFQTDGEYMRSAGPYANGLGGQAMSVYVEGEDRVYIMTPSVAEEFHQIFVANKRMDAIRKDREELTLLGHLFYLAVQAMDREVSADPTLLQQRSLALKVCRDRFQTLVDGLHDLYLNAKTMEEFYNCAIYIAPHHLLAPPPPPPSEDEEEEEENEGIANPIM